MILFLYMDICSSFKYFTKLLDLIGQFNEAALSDKKHPVFGFMTKEQWSKSGWKHIDHHLKQFGA